MNLKGNSRIFLCLIFSFIFFIPVSSFATNVTIPDPYIFTSAGGPFVIYNTDTGEAVGSLPNYHEGYELNSIFFDYTPGNYSIVENTIDGICQYYGWDYNTCIEGGYFVQIVDTITMVSPSGGGGESEETSGGGGGGNAFPPEVSVFPWKSMAIFSKDFLIDYKVRLQNEKGTNYEEDPKASVNLSPVSLFYSDKLAQWYGGEVSPLNKTLIAKDLPAIGQYKWDLKDLIPGTFYRLIIDALDMSGRLGEQVSEFFSVDFTAPTYVVTADPSVVKHEKVTITITPSEILATVPSVAVRQRGADPVPIKVIEKDGIYTGVYNVIDGYDGTAQVEIEGNDIAGNTGTLIVGGGTFTVGVNPPIKPVIISPTQNEKVTSSKIEIHGTTRDDTEIVATVNGVDKYKAKPNKKGEFIIKDVVLKKNALNGKNTINVVAKDSFDVVSDGAVLTILFNIAPTIEITRPKSILALAGMTTIGVVANDDNSDPLHFRYEISPVTKSGEDAKWQTLGDVPMDTFNFDTTKWNDGGYNIRVVADDGVSSTTSLPIAITIRNEMSFFIRFYDGLRTITKENQATVRGVVYAQKNISPSPTIKGLWYSTNNGIKWVKVLPQDGVFDSNEEKFSVLIQNLKDGINNVLWRTKDSRGFLVTTEQPIVVDGTPPLPPIILFPKNGSTITKSDNESFEKGKFSTTIRGTSEPASLINLEIDSKTYSGKTSFDGTFRIPGVSLSKNGNYSFVIRATDEAENTSLPISQKFLYDNPPTIVFTAPRDGFGVGKKTTISWLMSDFDGDNITNTELKYHRLGKAFVTLVKNPTSNSFDWDTSTLSEGNDYEISLSASDGFVTTNTQIPFSIDHSSPEILSFDLGSSLISKSGDLVASGTAQDIGSGVNFVEYRLVSTTADKKGIDLIPWQKTDFALKSIGKVKTFSIKSKADFADGAYQIFVRAVDIASNVSIEKSQNIIVDSTPPRVGSFQISSSETLLLPSADIFETVIGVPLSIKLSLENDTKIATLEANGRDILLVKDLATGLWEGTISFDEVGKKDLTISVQDNIGNTINKQTLAQFQVSPKGRILYIGSEQPLGGATISAIRIQSKKSIFSIFQSADSISTVSDENGYYALLLPAGIYRIEFKKDGFNTVTIEDLSIDVPTFVSNNISLSSSDNSLSLWDKILHMVHLK